ncbi:STAS domain-containing protein [Actinocrinis puniceicyclus]|uniref:Anti-sigma factor antagonist n=1 Tax=Actinocrinis puniceicyclus TaxID=977794 RepID=A0A8J7WIF4_9ACTN|nr:STAS domain-containing protein [Actinocrinis puniceicyclus]MBS2962896.1 STAS domain-containing protein [Actinocrinis puniceicyclus]
MERFEVGVGPAEGNGRVVTVRGELDLAAADQLWETIEPLLAPDALVVLDGTEMTFLDSSGLRVLLQAHKRAQADGALFRVVAPQQAVQRVLDLAGAAGHLAMRDDLAAALAG